MKRIFVAVFTMLLASQSMSDTLNDAVQQTLLSNPNVLLNTAMSLAAQQGIDRAKGGLFPTIDLSAGTGRQQSLNPTTTAIDGQGKKTLNRHESLIELRQTLFSGGAVVGEVQRNRYLTQAQEWKTQGVAEDLALDAVNRYLTVLLHEKLYILSLQNLNLHRQILGTIKQRADAGLSREAELYQSNGRLAAAEANRISAGANLREAQINYTKVVGKWPKKLRMPKLPARKDWPATIQKTLEIGLDSHPTVKSTYADVKEAKAQYKVARSSYFPRVEAVLNASDNRNLDGLVGPNDSRLAMLRVSYNAFRGGSDEARVRETAYRVQEAYEIRNRALIDLKEMVWLSWNTWSSAGERLKPLKEHVVDAGKTRTAYLEQFKLNKRTLLDYLDSQNELYESQIDYERGKMAEIFARYRIINSMGKLLPWLHMKVPVNVKNNDVFTSAQRHLLLNDNMENIPYPDISDQAIGLDGEVPTFEELRLTPAIVNKNATPPPQVAPKIWFVFAGHFQIKEEAFSLANRLRSLGFTVGVCQRNKRFEVLVGPYEYKEHAGNGMARLKSVAHVKGLLITVKAVPNMVDAGFFDFRYNNLPLIFHGLQRAVGVAMLQTPLDLR